MGSYSVSIIAGAIGRKPYLAYLFFDDNNVFHLNNSGAIAITTNAYNAWQKLAGSATTSQNGHLYIYVVSESNVSSANVYFDEMYIVHEKNNTALQVLQASDYYPYGLSFNEYNKERLKEVSPGLYAPELRNRYLFQNQELQKDLDLGWYHYKYRMHDPAIGRFGGVDPLAEDYLSNGTYVFSENKLLNGVELEGLEHVYTIHSATVSTSFKGAVLNGNIFKQREIMFWALNNKFNTSYAMTHTFMESERPVDGQIVSYRYDPSFSGVLVNTTSNIGNMLAQDQVSFMFPPYKEGLMFDKNYPVDVMPNEYYGGEDFRGIFWLGHTLEGGNGLSHVQGSAHGWGRIRGYGFVQFTADIKVENNAILNAGAFNGSFTGNYSGSNPGADFFYQKFSGKHNRWIGQNWQFSILKADYTLKEFDYLKQIFDDGSSIWNATFRPLSGYQQFWYYSNPR